jgi:putative FmdB family regulatory protein
VPIYEYKCVKCQQIIEKFQSVNDEPLKTCPVCGGEVRKQLYPAGLIFKGSGFYVTDSRKESGTSKSEDKSGGKEA